MDGTACSRIIRIGASIVELLFMLKWRRKFDRPSCGLSRGPPHRRDAPSIRILPVGWRCSHELAVPEEWRTEHYFDRKHPLGRANANLLRVRAR
ncbi:hypothetical protein E2562_025094 [Oryza meyeriana var. granulata]|uniref:Uncharacterized protein n=1 Tax=Oryza meyeriana var. granulata TaxID=110450 RepID=A0A6G1CI61_9ORYZ|nr:hypothetical protein E2562_025094 [Oryza meyeriana var. granulata]